MMTMIVVLLLPVRTYASEGPVWTKELGDTWTYTDGQGTDLGTIEPYTHL